MILESLVCILKKVGLHHKKYWSPSQKIWSAPSKVGLHGLHLKKSGLCYLRKSGLHFKGWSASQELLVCILENLICTLKSWSAWSACKKIWSAFLEKVGMHHNICMVCMILKILVCTCKSWSAQSASKKILVCRPLHKFHANL